MLQPIAINGIGGILLLLIGLLSTLLLALLFSGSKSTKGTEAEVINDLKDAKKESVRLKKLARKAEEMRKELHGKEKVQVAREMGKISKLWKSRRERLRMGIWEKIEAEPKELRELKKKEEEINNLIQRAKAKYHKRELDEESFREIISGYQKDLMELSLKIRQLERPDF